MPQHYSFNIEGHTLAAQGFNENLEGTPAVFLHGITTSYNFWVVGQTPIFKESYRWYSLSLPGHFPATLPSHFSRSELNPELIARVLGEAIRQLVGDKPVLLVGHSTGGFAALALAALYPQMVKGVISVAGFAHGRWAGTLGMLQVASRSGPPGRALFKLVLGALKQSRTLYRTALIAYARDWQATYDHPVLEPTLDLVYPDFEQLDLDSMLCYFRRMPSVNIYHLLPRIRVPTLVIAGDRDPIIPQSQPRTIAARVPNSALAWMIGAGHLPMIERDRQYTRVITGWLENVE